MSYKDHWKQEDDEDNNDNEELNLPTSRGIKLVPLLALVGSLLGVITGGIGIYTALDKRVLVLETNNSRQELRDITQDTDRLRISAESKEAFIRSLSVSCVISRNS